MPPKRKKRTARGDIDEGNFIYKLYSEAAESGMSGLDLIMNKERTTLELYKGDIEYYMSTEDLKNNEVKYRIQDQQYNTVTKEDFYNTTFQNIIY
jgi:hypothetical protein